MVLELSQESLLIDFSMEHLSCEDLWTGSSHYKNILETRIILNEGDIQEENVDNSYSEEEVE